MKRSVQYNNAGVACIEAGYHKVGWELFKGALEVKLALERGTIAHEDRNDAQSNSESKVNSYIQKAENHLLNLQKYLSAPFASLDRDMDFSQSETPTLGGLSATRESSRSKPSMQNLTDDMYIPFLFCKPIELPNDSQLSTRSESATIIFNLALVDHIKNRTSAQVVQLYELAMTLLAGDVVEGLGIALMNNIGVWCYENGDMDSTLVFMRHLSKVLVASETRLSFQERHGIRSNILWLTNPPIVASPAA